VRVRARVIVLAGPSGAGKSRLAERTGLTVLRLDDFYRNGSDPTLPRISDGAASRRLVPRLLRTSNAGLVDWDDPASWLADDALVAIEALCSTGTAEVPIYDIAHDGRTGTHTVSLDGARCFIAEGIFATEVLAPCRDRGLLGAAYCLRQHPAVTFWRRLTRDLRERRKPPLVLVRRGVALMRDQRRVVASAVAAGCRAVTPDEAYAEIERLR
jgi:uridine kinase